MYHYSLVDLLLFSAVAEESCLTRGARKAHLSLPSASLRMKSLEEALHVTLFNRKPRGIELTPAGEILNQHVNEIKQTLARMENEIAPYARLRSGVIRIAANYGAMLDFLPVDIPSFLKANPGVQAHLEQKTSPEVVEEIARGRADIGVTAFEGPYEGVKFRDYRKDELILAVPADHPLKDRETVDFSEALEYEFVTFDRDFAMQKFLYEKADEIGRVLKSRLEVEDPLILLRLVSEGLGIGVLSRKAFTSLSAYAKAVPVRLSNSWAQRELRIAVNDFDSNGNWLRGPWTSALISHLTRDSSDNVYRTQLL
jgi:DNA-binding transcriptional LysR family regulator